jgi:serine protease
MGQRLELQRLENRAEAAMGRAGGRAGGCRRWLALGPALLTLGACEQAASRAEQFGELVADSWAQIERMVTGGAPDDPLTAAPLEARALAGLLLPPTEPAPVSLDELLATQSFFVVGSVIAKPKAEMVEPVVAEDLEAVAAGTQLPPEASDAGMPESAELAPGPPAAARSAAPAPPEAAAESPLAGVEVPSVFELRRSAQLAPKVLREAVRDVANEPLKSEMLRDARALAEQRINVDSASAQRLGDELLRQAADAGPAVRELAVRSKLDVDAALNARERAYAKLEAMGLSGVVVPEAGGQMKIFIGADPTRFDPKDVDTVAELRQRFARNESASCEDPAALERMKSDPVLATECVVEALRATGEYEYVEKDFVFTPAIVRKPKNQAAPVGVSARPNDPLFGLQWNLKLQGAGAGKSAGGASFEDFWTRAKLTGSPQVTVAVVDTGVQMNHPDIAGSSNLAPGFDMVSDAMMGNDGDGRDPDPNDPGDKCDPADPSVEDTFHGTHVAGTIGVGSTDNATGVAGGAWKVRIVPVRALGRCGGRLSDINDAIRWAAGVVPARDDRGREVWNANPADVINLSIGLFEPCPASMQSAIDDAVAAGAVVVVAAGNARVDAKYFAPGGCRNVISVAANDGRGVLAPYSNFGANVSIMAPGGDLSRDDDGDGRPDGILSTKYTRGCYDPANPAAKVDQCYYAYENGTSMAAPHVSAALALLKAKFPKAVPSELRSRLMAASSPRLPLQCAGKCSSYPGTQPIPGQEGMCFRPCGGAMLNLANASVQ